MKINGFTLLETLIAVTILTLAVAGPLYTASRAIVAAQIAKDQLTASYLAQEGLEYVRAVRDDKYLTDYQANAQTASTQSWSDFKTAITTCATSCYLHTYRYSINSVRQELLACSGTCPVLYLAYVTSNKIYYYTTDSAASGALIKPYTRTIQVGVTPSNPNEIHATSTVTWSFHGSPYTVSVSDNLTPWQ